VRVYRNAKLRTGCSVNSGGHAWCFHFLYGGRWSPKRLSQFGAFENQGLNSRDNFGKPRLKTRPKARRQKTSSASTTKRSHQTKLQHVHLLVRALKCLTKKNLQLYKFYSYLWVELIQVSGTFMKMPDVPQLNVSARRNSEQGAEDA